MEWSNFVVAVTTVHFTRHKNKMCVFCSASWFTHIVYEETYTPLSASWSKKVRYFMRRPRDPPKPRVYRVGRNTIAIGIRLLLQPCEKKEAKFSCINQNHVLVSGTETYYFCVNIHFNGSSTALLLYQLRRITTVAILRPPDKHRYNPFADLKDFSLFCNG